MKKTLLILILLALQTQAGIIYLRVIDTTENQYSMIDVYQNDYMSQRYVKTINLTAEEMPVIGTNHNYSLIIQTKPDNIIYNLENQNQLSYIYAKTPKIITILLIITIIILIYRKGLKK